MSNLNEYDRDQQAREMELRRLDAARAAIADREDRERAANLAKAKAEREALIRGQEETRAAIAEAAARDERRRRMIGRPTIEATQAALCDLIDRVLALEEKLAGTRS